MEGTASIQTFKPKSKPKPKTKQEEMKKKKEIKFEILCFKA